MRPNRLTLTVPALTLVLGAVACSHTGQQDNPSQPPGPATSTASTPPPTPVTRESTPGDDPYTEAADRFKLAKTTIEQAVIDARLEMLKRGGPEGERLPAGILDPTILAVFANRLTMPASQAEPVLRFLVAQWDDYARDNKEDAALHAKRVAYMARELNISPRRVEWLNGLLLRRPLLAQGQPDIILEAIARDLGIPPQRLIDVLVGWKNVH